MGHAVDYAVPETPVYVDGDVTLVEQAVSNIVGNAVRYNRPSGHVAVVLESSDAPPRFSLRITDDGPGVPDDELGHLAERHFRGPEARTRRPDGLGLGLDIARHVAERHRFALQFARSVYGGLEVTLRGPRCI